MIQISFEKKDMWLFFSLAAFLVAAGYAIAYGSNNPTLHGHDAGEIAGIKSGITWLNPQIRVDARLNTGLAWTVYTNPQFANKTILVEGRCGETVIYVNPIGVTNRESFNAVCAAGDNENDVGVNSVWVGPDGKFQYTVSQTDPPTSSFALNITAYMG